MQDVKYESREDNQFNLNRFVEICTEAKLSFAPLAVEIQLL